MDIDKLKKLTRLANNNPNENEANLAARKVCKMLEEGNWALPVVATTQQTGPTQNTTYTTTQPPSGSHRPNRPPDWNYGFDPFDELFRRAAEADKQKRRKEEAERRAQEEAAAWRAREDKYRAEQRKQREEAPFTQDPKERYYTWTGASARPEDTWVLLNGYPRRYVNTRTGEEITELEYQAKWAYHTRKPWAYHTRKPEERDLTCSVCGAVHKTKFMGLAELFICFGCQRKV